MTQQQHQPKILDVWSHMDGFALGYRWTDEQGDDWYQVERVYPTSADAGHAFRSAVAAVAKLHGREACS